MLDIVTDTIMDTITDTVTDTDTRMITRRTRSNNNNLLLLLLRKRTHMITVTKKNSHTLTSMGKTSMTISMEDISTRIPRNNIRINTEKVMRISTGRMHMLTSMPTMTMMDMITEINRRVLPRK